MAPYGLEDETHFLLSLLSEAEVFDASAIFVEKATGRVETGPYLLVMEKVAAMVPIGPWPEDSLPA